MNDDRIVCYMREPETEDENSDLCQRTVYSLLAVNHHRTIYPPGTRSRSLIIRMIEQRRLLQWRNFILEIYMRLKSTLEILVEQRQELVNRRIPAQSSFDRHDSFGAASIVMQKANSKMQKMNVLLMYSRPHR